MNDNVKATKVHAATGHLVVATRVGDVARQVAAYEMLRDAKIAYARDKAEARVAEIRREIDEKIAQLRGAD
ncbi:hypothetical protein [Kribbella sp.]|uniref:hypothetical protein n=1 Tax=Kribbella sp. TaxID=1871183 RepID=UPI002D31A3AB|nr:hypothetical protein [Kribbella sp.]HZX07199.1 hypothetical protein [Kribbella sp.]